MTFIDLLIENQISDLTLVCEMTVSSDMNSVENTVIEDLHVL